MLLINNLKVSFKEKNVLQNLNLNISKGEIFGILGKNGAGKTTLFQSIYQNINYSGEILIDNAKASKAKIGFVETENYFYPYMLGSEYLSFFKDIKNLKTAFIEKFDIPLKKYIDSYSTGMKKKIALIGAILLDKPFLILDEPFNGLDFESVEILYSVINDLKNNNKTILISSHILETLTNTCDRIGILKDGMIENIYSKNDFSEMIANRDTFIL
jgi:ABC-2 type transport system ATP-binding protein